MNKIYALKYCHATGGLIAVSELASRVMKKAARGSLLALFNLSLYGAFLSASQAAQLNIDNVWARDYLDLAQNTVSYTQVPESGDLLFQPNCFQLLRVATLSIR
ncbi:serine protease [Escherichia coli]|nr:serine protease [Escherichia coli]